MGGPASPAVARRNKGEEKAIARERIERLVTLADQAMRQGLLARAMRYGDLAWRIKTTYQLRPSPIDRRVCRNCHAFLGPATTRVRLTRGKLSTTCLRCGHVRRRPLGPRAAAPASQRS